jgi:hypothetical protein
MPMLLRSGRLTGTRDQGNHSGQKQELGERLYPLVHDVQPELAGKITGMLLEMDNSKLLLLLDSQDQLSWWIAEAIKVLDEHDLFKAWAQARKVYRLIKGYEWVAYKLQ